MAILPRHEEAIIYHRHLDLDFHKSRHRRRGNSRVRRPRSASYNGSSCKSGGYGYKRLHYLVDEEEGRQDAPLDDAIDSHSSSVAYSSSEFWRVLWRGGGDTHRSNRKESSFHLNHAAGDNNFASPGLTNVYRRVNESSKSSPSLGNWSSRQATISNPTLTKPTKNHPSQLHYSQNNNSSLCHRHHLDNITLLAPSK